MQTPSKTIFTKSLPLILTTLLSLVVSASAYSLEPSTIVYQVELDSDRLGKATLGRVETQLSENDGRFSVASHTKAEGLAAILLGNLTETCDFNIVDGRAQSQTYSGGRPSKTEYFVDFNWEERKIKFNGEETLDMPQGYLINNCNMPFALALLKDNEITETVYIVDGKKTRIRGYRLKSKSREMLNTKIGSLDTVKIVFERDLKSEKTLTLWLSKKHYFLPVKMQERREDRITTMFVSEFSTDG
ncbi:MAG: DUF3108 domain-containing protein [Arenicella sp.]|jgi:hypothetical protein|nr:DUF3108 domain-containing protein [Arenicella sp.]HAU69247.1 hypothetical protein [Gammaproteobacteria bacterium]